MELIDNLERLKKLTNKKSKTISSKDIKDEIKNNYELWLKFKEEIKKDCPQDYSLIVEDFENFYSFYSKSRFSKTKILRLLKKLITKLDKIRLNNFSKGINFKEDYKEKVYSLLNEKEFSQVLVYLNKAESEIKKDAETSCGKSREAIEEFFRVIREKIERKTILRGTLGQHVFELEKRKLISQVESQFFKKGVYSFLSEKGNHANKERKEEIDALFGFKLVIITIEYIKNLSLF